MIDLTEMSQSKDSFTRSRASVVLLRAKGTATSDIAHAVGMSDRYVRQVLLLFRHQGMAAMQKGKSSGRPCTLSESGKAALLELLERRPRDCGIDRDTWTLTSLAEVMCREGVCGSVSKYVLQRAMKQMGVDWTELRLKGAAKIAADDNVAGGNRVPSTGVPTVRRGLYADRLLSLGEGELYDEVIRGLRRDFADTPNALHMELAAVYSVKMIRAQDTADWEQTERFDRMMHSHLKELKAAKRKQDAREPERSGDTPAERATALVEALRAEEARAVGLHGEDGDSMEPPEDGETGW